MWAIVNKKDGTLLANSILGYIAVFYNKEIAQSTKRVLSSSLRKKCKIIKVKIMEDKP